MEEKSQIIEAENSEEPKSRNIITIDLTSELIALIKAIADVSKEIRLYSSYGRTFPYVFNELDGLDLLYLTDSIEGLGDLVGSIELNLNENPCTESRNSLIKLIHAYINKLKPYLKHDATRNWEQPFTTFKAPSLIIKSQRPGVIEVAVLKRNNSKNIELKGFIPGMIKIKDQENFFVQYENQLVDEEQANTPIYSECNRRVLIVRLIGSLMKIIDKIQESNI